MDDRVENENPILVPTGIEGLDEILAGGLVAHHLYLVEGNPGSGKTTLALQFLLAGVKRGEPCLFVTLSETESELRASAASHGWTLDGIHIFEITASEESLKTDVQYTMFHPSEVELGETTKKVLEEARKIKPARLVFDSLSEFRLLSENPLRYRRQILALKQYFSRQQCTVLFIDDRVRDNPIGGSRDMQLHSLAHGVISLEYRTGDYGTTRRWMQVTKLRGRAFREGNHDMRIRRGGIEVFSRLVAAEHRDWYAPETIKSNLEGLDRLLGGGLSKGTSTLIIGGAGTGKSSLATQFVHTAAKQGQHASVFLFDETVNTYLDRSLGLGMELREVIAAGKMSLRQIDPAELSPGEFAYSVRKAVDQKGSKIVVIDSLSGYLNAMPNEHFLSLHLHELLTFLNQRGVTTLLLLTQHGIFGSATESPVDASYLADSVLLLRYFEAFGEVRQAVSVIKKRTGKHERSIRELRFDNGIQIGEPIREFEGILAGEPRFVGDALPKTPPSR